MEHKIRTNHYVEMRKSKYYKFFSKYEYAVLSQRHL